MKRPRLHVVMHLLRRSRDAMRRSTNKIVAAYRTAIAEQSTARARLRRPSWKGREPNGRSFRSLRRAFNRGWLPPKPDDVCLRRYGRA